MIIQGTYSLTFSAPNYYSKTISGVYAKNDSTTTLNVQLRPIFIGIAGNNESPGEFRLYQNYPNPFNPATKIPFSIPPGEGVRGRDVKLISYDILGREVATLVNKQLSPDTYEVEFDGLKYPSGVYYYTLSAGEFKETR